MIGLLVVGTALLLQSQRLFEDSRTLATATRVIHDWAPDHLLEDILIDRQDGATHIDVRVVGTEPPPATGELASMLASALRDDVVAGVTFTALDQAAARAPAG